MNDEELMRRISDALDAPGGLEDDADLRAALEGDSAASLYAEDLQSIGAALTGLADGRPEPDWDAQLAKLDSVLDGDFDAAFDALDDIGDPTLAPVFSDADDSAGLNPEVLTPELLPGATSAVRPTAAAGKVVDLASARQKRMRLFAAVGGLAAAAAVGLGIMVGLDGSPSAPMEGFALQEEAAPAATAPAAPSSEAAGEMPEAEAALAERFAPSADPQPPAEEAADYLAEPAPAAPPAPVEMPRQQASRFALGGGAGSAGGRGIVAPATTRSAAGPAPGNSAANPTRAQVVNALNTVATSVQRCIGESGQMARVHVRVNGSTGRIESATVGPPHTGTVARCVVRAVRGAEMPTSAHPSYEVDHVYHPAPIAGGSLRQNSPAARRRMRAAPPSRESRGNSAELLDAWGD